MNSLMTYLPKQASRFSLSLVAIERRHVIKLHSLLHIHTFYNTITHLDNPREQVTKRHIVDVDAVAKTIHHL
jgi:hypothetical protein